MVSADDRGSCRELPRRNRRHRLRAVIARSGERIQTERMLVRIPESLASIHVSSMLARPCRDGD